MRGRLNRVLPLVLCIMMYCTVAMAEKIDYKDNQYNFKNIKTVVLCHMDFSQANLDSTAFQDELQTLYIESSSGSNLTALSNEQLVRKISLSTRQNMKMLEKQDMDTYNRMYWEHLPEYADAYVIGKLVEYKSKTTHHTDIYAVSIDTRKTSKSDGNENWDKFIDDYSSDKPAISTSEIERNEYDTTEYDVTAEFHIYDSKTNKEIFIRRYSLHQQADDGGEVFTRICDKFFHDFDKLTR